jgi:MFS family permease
LTIKHLLEAGLIGAAVYLGMMVIYITLTKVGAFIGGITSDRFGRKFVFITSFLIAIIFAFVSAFSNGPIMFIVCRFLSGIGLGSSVPTDISL